VPGKAKTTSLSKFLFAKIFSNQILSRSYRSRENFKVALKMVLDLFKNCALAHKKAFLQRKNIFAKWSAILAFLGTLTDVLLMHL